MGAQQSTLLYLSIAVIVAVVAVAYAIWKTRVLMNEHTQLKSMIQSCVSVQDISEDILPSIQTLEEESCRLRGDLDSILLTLAPGVMYNPSMSSEESKTQRKSPTSPKEKEEVYEESNEESDEGSEVDEDENETSSLTSVLPGMQNMAMLMSMGKLFAKSSEVSIPVTRVLVEGLDESNKRNTQTLSSIAEVKDEDA